jgi:hypothetical protein
MDLNKALAFLVALMMMTFTLRLYRKMLLSYDGSEAVEPAKEREFPDGLLEQRLSFIHRCRLILDVTILALAAGIAMLAR